MTFLRIRRPGFVIVLLTLLVMAGTGYLLWPHAKLLWDAAHLRKSKPAGRDPWLMALYDDQALLRGMDIPSFAKLVAPVCPAPSGVRQWRYVNLPMSGTPDSSSFFQAIFVENSFVSFEWSSSGCPDLVDVRCLFEPDSDPVVGDDVLFAAKRWGEEMSPLLLSYLRRCPSPRSRLLCCYVLHQITDQDLPPSYEAWSAWWAKRKPSP